MDRCRTIRSTTVASPGIEDDALVEVATLDGDRDGRLDRFRLSGGDWRALELTDQQLTGGRISGLKVARAKLTGVTMTSVVLDRSDLSSAAWHSGRLDRVHFIGCKLLGATFTDISMEDVLFEGCKLGLAAFESLRAKGAVAFVGCTLDEATFTACDLTGAVLEKCSLRGTAFERGTYKDFDLRGNDLSQVRGVAALRRTIIDPAQTTELGQALAADLGMRFPDED